MKAAGGALALLAALFAAPPGTEGLELSGSLAGSAAYLGLRDCAFYPDAHGSLPDYTADTTATLAAEAGERSRLSFAARCRLDAVTGGLSAEILRAYAEARIGEYLAFGLGRRLAGFGCGLIWNPVNGIDAPRNPFDRDEARAGRDGAFASLELGGATGFPLSLHLQALAPLYEEGVDLAQGTLAAQAYSYIGGIELGLAGDCADPAGERPGWSAGAWGTVDLAGVVLGIETSWRKSGELWRPDAAGLPVLDLDPYLSALATASWRIGDFFFYLEGLYSDAGLAPDEARRVQSAPSAVLASYAFVAQAGSIGSWHAVAGLEWSREPWTCALVTLADLEEGSGAVAVSGSWGVDERAVLGFEGAVLLRGQEVSEYDFLPYGWSCGLYVEVYY